GHMRHIFWRKYFWRGFFSHFKTLLLMFKVTKSSPDLLLYIVNNQLFILNLQGVFRLKRIGVSRPSQGPCLSVKLSILAA
ncbi:MAG: hypothetical protein WCZ43_03765, partial [Proteiniphilum sp.]